MRALTLIAVALSFATAFALYHMSYVTKQLEAGVHSQERATERLRSDIAALRAERAYLSRPQRIEPLARQLGLRPITENATRLSDQAALTAEVARAVEDRSNKPTGAPAQPPRRRE